MPHSAYEIRSLIVCDDVRQEANGKQILIGVYNDRIIVRELPAALPRLVIRLAVALKSDVRSFRFALRAPDNENILDTTGDVEADAYGDPIVIGLALQPVIFAKEGAHSMWFSMGADELRQIGVLTVSLPKSSDERERLR